MNLKRSILFPAITFAAFGLAGPVEAVTVITAGGQTLVASGGMAPGSPTNYDFGDFGNAGQPTVLTDFTVSTAGTLQFQGTTTYTSVIAPDGTGPFITGIAYDGVLGPAHTGLIATFSPTSNGNFSVWVLDGNTDGISVGNVSVGLGVDGGAAVTTSTIYNGSNEFTRYNVTGALTTSVFQVYATTDFNYASLGGLTFTNLTAVPEPSSIAMLGLGIAALLVSPRCRRKPVA